MFSWFLSFFFSDEKKEDTIDEHSHILDPRYETTMKVYGSQDNYAGIAYLLSALYADLTNIHTVYIFIDDEELFSSYFLEFTGRSQLIIRDTILYLVPIESKDDMLAIDIKNLGDKYFSLVSRRDSAFRLQIPEQTYSHFPLRVQELIQCFPKMQEESFGTMVYLLEQHTPETIQL